MSVKIAIKKVPVSAYPGDRSSKRVRTRSKKAGIKKNLSVAEMNRRFAETEDACIAAAEVNCMKILGRKRL